MASLCCACGVTWTGSHRCGETPDEAAFRRNRDADLRAADWVLVDGADPPEGT